MDKWTGLEQTVKDEIILIYSQKMKVLDGILSNLTKDYCKHSCTQVDNIGCCNYNHYKIGVSDEILEKQVIESNMFTSGKGDYQCKYHSTSSGCQLTEYKPPICVSFLCGSLQKHIRKFDDTLGIQFIDALKDVGKANFFIHGENILATFDFAIEYGLRLEDKIFSPKDL